MKKYITYCASIMALAALSACSDTFNFSEEGDGEGRLMLKANINSDVVVKSRAGETNDELAKSTLIWISNDKGAVYKYEGIDQVPAAGIKLVSGNYIAEAWAGDSVSASWDSRYFKGREDFQITKGSATQVTIECKIANSLVSVEYSDKISELLDDVTLEVGHDKSTGTRNPTVTFDSSTAEGAKAYFMMNSRSKDLLYTLRGTRKSNGQAFEYSGTIADAKPATEYHLTVKHEDQAEEEIGGAWITIVVDESEVEVADTYEITAAPVVTGYQSGSLIDLSDPVTGMVGDMSRTSLWIAAAANLTSVELKSPAFETISGLGGDDFELFGMTDAIRTVVEKAGINYVYTTHDDSALSEMKLNFELTFLNSLPEGDYTITIVATDANGRSTTAKLRVMPTNAKVLLQDIDPTSPEITSRSAVFTASVLQEDATDYGIMYRVKGTQQWTKVAATSTSSAAAHRRVQRRASIGDTYTVELTNLKPATTYQIAAYCEGFESTSVQEFTTDAEPQLPNASFESWCTGSDKALIPSDSATDFFWDSGNHGSITLSKNITQSSTDYVHTGSYSIKLESQFVGVGIFGKFAAGNVFVGKYLDTDGTDGILGWGRSFTGRPKALRAWVKYTPAAITDASTNPDGAAKGDMDKGMIYIALTDTTLTSTTLPSTKETVKWPVIIKTKSSERSLFNKDADNIIAYGEKVFTEATSGDGLIEITIPLDYKRTDVRPSNIVVVASASKLGDYFTGGPSVMYIDDFELIYE
jgi:hypothetical protein